MVKAVCVLQGETVKGTIFFEQNVYTNIFYYINITIIFLIRMKAGF